jgi:hypothetical protein
MRRGSTRRASQLTAQSQTLMDNDFKEHACLAVVDAARVADALPSCWTVSPDVHDDALSRCLVDQLPVICAILGRNASKFGGLDNIHPGAHVVGVSSLCEDLFGKVFTNNNKDRNADAVSDFHVEQEQQPLALPTMPTVSDLRRAFARHPNILRWLSGMYLNQVNTFTLVE